MLRNRIISLLLAVIMLIGLLPAATAADTGAPIKIACVGDSITYGHNPASPTGNPRITENWPKLLGDMLGDGYEVGNFGHSGATLMNDGQIVYRNVSEFTQSKNFNPDIVIIMLGTNDTNPQQNWNKHEAFKEQLKDLIGVYQALPSNPEVYVATCPTAFHTGAFSIHPENIHNIIVHLQEEVAEELGLPLIDIHTATADCEAMFPDDIHPNVDGHKVIAEEMYAALTTPSGHTHDYTETVTPPTCTERGYTTRYCAGCGRTSIGSYVDALGHAWDEGTVTLPPTDDTPGVRTLHCTQCDATKTKRIPPLNAKVPADIDFTDTASADAFEIVNNVNNIAIAEGVGLTLTTSRPAFEPCNGQNSGEQATNPEEVVVIEVEGDWSATLTVDFSTGSAANGYYQFFGFYASEGDDYQNMAGIRGGDGAMQDFLRTGGELVADTNGVKSEPGFASAGTYYLQIVKEGTTYICNRSANGEDFTEMFRYEDTGIEADKIVIDAYTGMTAGYEFLVKSLTFEAVGDIGNVDCKHEHKETVGAKKATCGAEGYTGDVVCKDCDEKLETGKTIPATGEHTWGEWTETTPATATADGEETRTCSVCKATETRAIPKLNFVDVTPDRYYYNAVQWAVDKGITTGVDETHFAPNDDCTRAQAVMFLWNAAGCPEVAETVTNPFTDVTEGRYYYKAVLWAISNNITDGTDDTHFSPNKKLDRATFVTFLWRAKGKVEVPATDKFTDVKPGKFYTTAVAWAVANGITDGKTDTTFAPGAVCTRAQVVTFLQRAYGE